MNCHWYVDLTLLKPAPLDVRFNMRSYKKKMWSIGVYFHKRLWHVAIIPLTYPGSLSYGKQVDLSASSGPLCSPWERQQDAHKRAGNDSSLHETKTQYSQDLMPVNRGDFKVIMLPEVGCFIAFTGILQRPTGATVPASPLPNDARRALRDGG